MVNKALVKIVDKILKNPKNIAFDELSKLLEGLGFERCQPKGGSSHYIFRKTGSQPISVPKAKPVNQVYVKQVVKLLNLEEWYEENR